MGFHWSAFIYWFGRIVGDFIGDQHILPIIITGGITGAAAFYISANFLPYTAGITHHALGASAGAMALVVAGAAAPTYRPSNSILQSTVAQALQQRFPTSSTTAAIAQALGRIATHKLADRLPSW